MSDVCYPFREKMREYVIVILYCRVCMNSSRIILNLKVISSCFCCLFLFAILRSIVARTKEIYKSTLSV